jgi:signal transduction histidine kinase
MSVDTDAEILRLRAGLRDLVALSTIPATWVGREPRDVAGGLAVALIGLLQLDFAFVRLSDPGGGGAVEAMQGDAWTTFPQWLQLRFAANSRLSGKEIVLDVGGGEEPYRGVVIPIGVDAEGGVVAAASDRTDFPTEIDQLLLSLAANHAATSFQGARLIHERRKAEAELRQARNDLEVKVAERTAELLASRARVVAAADEARRHLVRDLHDGAQQRLIHTVVTLQLALQAQQQDDGTTAEALVAEGLEHANRANAELRELAHGLHPSVLARGGLRAGVAALVSRTTVPVVVEVSVQRLVPEIEANAYFVVAEALTNVAKHSGAESAAVKVWIEDGALHLEVRDDGVGGARPGGPGLVGLADRLAALNGRLRVVSPPNGGTLIAATLPLPA